MDLPAYCEDLARRARQASRLLAAAPGARKNGWLVAAADGLEKRTPEILAANARDVASATEAGLAAAQIDRLRLTPERVRAAATGLREIAALPDPVGRVLGSNVRPNGLHVHKIAVPLGVIFFIYESRPNVTVDAAGLCVKSGNAVILRGGKESLHSNAALHTVLDGALSAAELPGEAVQLVSTTDREAVGNLLKLDRWIDLVIPRGGESLIRRVAAEARMPVLKHYQGNCHVYVDAAADLDMALAILLNAKCQRPGVCNAAESLLVHADVAAAFLPRAGAALSARGVEVRGCPETCQLVTGAKPASDFNGVGEATRQTLTRFGYNARAMPLPLEYSGQKPRPPSSDDVPWWLWAIVAALLAGIIFYWFVVPAYQLRQLEREKSNRHGIYPG